MELLEFDHPEFDPIYMPRVYCGNLAVARAASSSCGHRLPQAIDLAYPQLPLRLVDDLEVEILGRRSGARVIAPV